MSTENIIEMLHNFSAPNVFNPWRDTDPLDMEFYGPEERRRRLRQHFDIYNPLTKRPLWLLIGEAPGYQGCHFSGIPFTSEALLCEGVIPRVNRCERFTTRRLPWREPSATIVWNVLKELQINRRTVLWNAFAFHPHEPGEPLSNRKPTRYELLAGQNILRGVVDHFRRIGAQTVAIGNVAHETLASIGVYCEKKVRHPANGGAPQFRADLRALVVG